MTSYSYDRVNNITGLISYKDFDITDLDKFVEGLQQEYNVASVKRADFVKAKNSEAHAFLVTFRKDYLPDSIYDNYTYLGKDRIPRHILTMTNQRCVINVRSMAIH